MKLYFVHMGSGTFHVERGEELSKVITGKLETPTLGYFAKPFEIRNTHIKEKTISAGPGAASRSSIGEWRVT